jgi:hypothetical protein
VRPAYKETSGTGPGKGKGAVIAARVGQTTGLIIAAAIVLLVLGAFLSFNGYSRD